MAIPPTKGVGSTFFVFFFFIMSQHISLKHINYQMLNTLAQRGEAREGLIL